MPLTGQAKVNYQREYMRRRRSNQRSNADIDNVRPKVLDPVIPKPQSWNPMLVGYVPPQD